MVWPRRIMQCYVRCIWNVCRQSVWNTRIITCFYTNTINLVRFTLFKRRWISSLKLKKIGLSKQIEGSKRGSLRIRPVFGIRPAIFVLYSRGCWADVLRISFGNLAGMILISGSLVLVLHSWKYYRRFVMFLLHRPCIFLEINTYKYTFLWKCSFLFTFINRNEVSRWLKLK